MKILKTTLTSAAILLLVATNNANATDQYAADLSFNGAIEQSILSVQASSYKDIYVTTVSGSVAGEFVQKTKDVLILKEYTGSTHAKTGKEKVALMFIKLDSIVSISTYILE